MQSSKKLVWYTLLIGLVSISTFAQDIGIGDAKKYVIGEISVTGVTTYNERTVIAFTGLRKGEEIYLPGDRLSQVINKLWELGLFSDINFYLKDVTDGNVAHLELEINEVPKLNDVKIRGVKNKKKEDLKKDLKLQKGTKLTENFIANTKNQIKNDYRKKGYLNVDPVITTQVEKDSLGEIVGENMMINIKLGEKIKVSEIEISGNEDFSDRKIRKFMKNTKQKNFFRFYKRSKLIPADYEEDKERVVEKLKERGYRDARIISDSVIKGGSESTVKIELELKEGNQYYFGEVTFLGNSVYSDRELRNLLEIRKGDAYNGVLLDEKITGGPKQKEGNITDTYQDNGYLFSRITPVETKVYNDTIDFEIRITEGPIAYFNNVKVKGNDRTHDHVAYRNLRTLPGEQYSKKAVMSTARELSQLGFFDPESIRPDIQNPNPVDGTVDIEYNVEEQGASQVQLQGGYGGGGFIGTLGLSFNNFSLRGISDKDAWKPLPMGDGQTLSLRAQASIAFQNYSLNFVEPWLGGKKPVQLSVSVSQTKQFLFDPFTRRADRSRQFSITGVNVGLGKRLRVPDEYFFLSTSVGFQHFNLQNYNVGLFRFPNGYSNNVSFTVGLRRDNTYSNPIFPMGGSRFNINFKFTPPYSVFNNVDYEQLSLDRDVALAENNDTRLAEIDQQRFNWLEFYKVNFSGEWFNRLFDKLVLRKNIEFGFIGAYNNDRGIPPFERFFLGGDGLAGFAMDGREIIALRGYPNQSIIPRTRTNVTQESFNDGATIYNKFTLDLRYPITLNPSASIYGLAFFEAGSTFDSFKEYSPFDLSRSAGAGVRIFMPQFGLLGIDFGYGFDPIPGSNTGANGWETHFIIGQQF
ncbi:outer membrane protein assembly factor BamA [Psychroflexus planctonicus]|uniref:Outer membrane protein assembly factor BamA n=2 Tax=Psychroflexus planctonicus TaxID=1526575 RepID=A0ABQ1SGF5_9FLAO|nr:outer membrane protein assembly factor BamA [Psychroflexus planctonicus]